MKQYKKSIWQLRREWAKKMEQNASIKYVAIKK